MADKQDLVINTGTTVDITDSNRSLGTVTIRGTGGFYIKTGQGITIDRLVVVPEGQQS